MSKKTLVGARAIRSREDHSDEKITHHEVGWSPLRNHPINVRGGQVSDWEELEGREHWQLRTHPCPGSGERQGWRGGKGHDGHTGMIYSRGSM
jgi:hypothetical protein